MELAAQRGSGGPIPGNIQDQAGQGLSNLIYLAVSLLAVGGLGSITSRGPFRPKTFYDLLVGQTAKGWLSLSGAKPGSRVCALPLGSLVRGGTSPDMA